MKLTFVNTGYGEAVLLELQDASRPGGVFTALIDGGGADPQEFEERSSGRIPVWEYLKKRGLSRLSVALCTHIHEDHISGLRKAADGVEIEEFWQTLPEEFYKKMRSLELAEAENLSQSKFLQALNDYRELCGLVKERGGRIRTLHRGQSVFLGEDAELEVLAPSPKACQQLEMLLEELYREEDSAEFHKKLSVLDGRMNNYSLILRVRCGAQYVLLPGDTNRDGYGEIPAEKLKAHLFKIGHHGQKDGVSETLLRMVDPEAAVCCASSDRRYDSAHPDVIRMLSQAGIHPYFSDCPKAEGIDLPPHQALEFELEEGRAVTGRYLRVVE